MRCVYQWYQSCQCECIDHILLRAVWFPCFFSFSLGTALLPPLISTAVAHQACQLKPLGSWCRGSWPSGSVLIGAVCVCPVSESSVSVQQRGLTASSSSSTAFPYFGSSFLV